MQQASNSHISSALRRAALVAVVALALAVMFFASCMMVSAHAAVQQGEAGQGVPGPSPTAPEPVTFLTASGR
jgi:hypothetical protein